MKYRTIVADPPWDATRPIGGFGGDRERNRECRNDHGSAYRPLDYPVMSIPEIAALPVRDLSESHGSHLYLWVTSPYLESAYGIVRGWGFRHVATLVWCKPHGGFVGGAFYANVEFVFFCRQGSLPVARKTNSRWFTWPRGGHSEKPEAFLDLVEQVSPGPYLELFARRQRLGWDTWGDEALEHVVMESA